MSRATSLALHRATCRDSGCGYCQNRAEERAADRDADPRFADDYMDNVAEREMEAVWP